jgi:hypothetical protein
MLENQSKKGHESLLLKAREKTFGHAHVESKPKSLYHRQAVSIAPKTM